MGAELGPARTHTRVRALTILPLPFTRTHTHTHSHARAQIRALNPHVLVSVSQDANVSERLAGGAYSVVVAADRTAGRS